MTISYTGEAKFPLLDTGASNWGAVINGILTSLDKGIDLTFIAGENLLIYDLVYISSVNTVMKADADNAAKRPAVGMATAAVSLGAEIKVKMFGWIDYDDSGHAALGATAGNIIYLSTIAGRPTITPYGLYPQVFGIAKTTTVAHITRIFICPVILKDYSSNSIISYVQYGETISALKVTYLTGNKAYIASSSTVNQSFRIFGVAITAANINEWGYIQQLGVLYDASWSWDVTKPIFVGPTGQLTQTVPTSGFVCQVAMSIATNMINIVTKLEILKG